MSPWVQRPSNGFGHQHTQIGWSCVIASQETWVHFRPKFDQIFFVKKHCLIFLGSTYVIIPPRSRILQWSRHSFNWKKNKKELQKLHRFGLKYNLRQKYNALFTI